MEITPIMIAVFLLGIAIGYILGQLKILLIKKHTLDIIEAKKNADKRTPKKRKPAKKKPKKKR